MPDPFRAKRDRRQRFCYEHESDDEETDVDEHRRTQRQDCAARPKLTARYFHETQAAGVGRRQNPDDDTGKNEKRVCSTRLLQPTRYPVPAIFRGGRASDQRRFLNFRRKARNPFSRNARTLSPHHRESRRSPGNQATRRTLSVSVRRRSAAPSDEHAGSGPEPSTRVGVRFPNAGGWAAPAPTTPASDEQIRSR